MKKVLKKLQVSEHLEQVALVNRLRKEGHFVFAIPNGGKRDAVTGCHLKNEGVVAGIPDLCVLTSAGRVFWIELKTREKGKLSAVQKKIHETFEKHNQTVLVGLGAKDAYEKFQSEVAKNGND